MKNLLLWFLLIFILAICFASFDDKKKKKGDLANYYNVTKPTLQKWVELFQCPISLNEWNKKRFLTSSEYNQMQFELGTDVALNKKQIAERAESDYNTVAENVLMNLEKIGITKEAWESCSKFPPVIYNRILKVLG
jgi:hypothetical protein